MDSSPVRLLKKGLRAALPLLVLLAAYLAIQRIYQSRPRARRQKPPAPVLQVEVEPLRPGRFPVVLESRGAVRAPIESRLAAEVAGRVSRVAEAFRDGGFFKKGDTLVEIDRRDYRFAIRRRQEEVAQARARLAELEAEAAGNARLKGLAVRMVQLASSHLVRLQNLARRGVATEAALEESQRAELTARVRLEELERNRLLVSARLDGARSAAALALVNLDSARLDLERTRVLAPYDGRVLQRSVAVGDFASRGAPLAVVYAVDRAEVRLPLTDRQLAFVDLPDGNSPAGAAGAVVVLSGTHGGRTYRWPGRLVRTEGTIDTASRQLFVIAQVDDPYGRGPGGRPPLRVGAFVRAEIAGRVLEGVFVLRRERVQGENEILVIPPGSDVMRRQTVEVVRRDPKVVVARGHFPQGTRLCRTPVMFAGDAIRVRVENAGEAPALASGSASGNPRR